MRIKQEKLIENVDFVGGVFMARFDSLCAVVSL
jgi:hypothetical protein